MQANNPLTEILYRDEIEAYLKSRGWKFDKSFQYSPWTDPIEGETGVTQSCDVKTALNTQAERDGFRFTFGDRVTLKSGGLFTSCCVGHVGEVVALHKVGWVGVHFGPGHDHNVDQVFLEKATDAKIIRLPLGKKWYGAGSTRKLIYQQFQVGEATYSADKRGHCGVIYSHYNVYRDSDGHHLGQVRTIKQAEALILEKSG